MSLTIIYSSLSLWDRVAGTEIEVSLKRTILSKTFPALIGAGAF